MKLHVKYDTLIFTILGAGANAIALTDFDSSIKKWAGVIGAMAGAGLLCLKQYQGSQSTEESEQYKPK